MVVYKFSLRQRISIFKWMINGNSLTRFHTLTARSQRGKYTMNNHSTRFQNYRNQQPTPRDYNAVWRSRLSPTGGGGPTRGMFAHSVPVYPHTVTPPVWAARTPGQSRSKP
jgi:hypothetical protein